MTVQRAADRSRLAAVATRTTVAMVLTAITAFGAEVNAAEGIFTPVATVAEQRARVTQPDVRRLALDPLDRADPRSTPSPVEVLRSRSVGVDASELSTVRAALEDGRDARVRLNLFSDVDLNAEMHRVADTRYGWSLSGRIEGDPHGSVTMVVHGDIVAGAVHTRDGSFVIGSRGGTVHAVQEVSGDFACGVDGRSHEVAWRDSATRAPVAAASDDDGSEVDLLVLFTQAALELEGSLRRMRASIDLAVAWANDAYEASGVNLRLSLVAAALVDYEESRARGSAGVTNQWFDLQYAIAPNDGVLEEAHALRESYAADVVHLIVDQPGGGGVGELLKVEAEDPSAFAFSVSNSLSWPTFLAHEVGHVMGLLHDRYEEADSGWAFAEVPLHAYAYGYVNQRAFDSGASQESRWRTIMSYDTQCRHQGFTCSQIQRFSNPDRKHPAGTGDSLGVAGVVRTDAVEGPADGVRSLNERRSLITGYRDSATRCDYRLSGMRRDVAASGGEFSVEVDAARSCTWTATAFGEHVELTSDAAGKGPGEVTYRVMTNDGPARIGHVVLAGEMLAVYQSGAIAPVSVCERTPQVRDGITNVTGSTCGAVSEFDLLEVRSLDLATKSIDTVRDGDFAGLANLVELRLRGNPGLTIEDGAFGDLRNLKLLDLCCSDLDVVPPAIRSLRSLTRLNLYGNPIRSLASDAFSGLSELRYLHLANLELTSLPEGVFSDQRRLLELYLYENRITEITKEMLRGPQDLLSLRLNGNPLGELRPDAFAAIPKIWSLNLRRTQLRTIPSQAIANVVSTLDVSDNLIEDVSGTTFPGWSLGRLNLANNSLSALPPGVFAGFTSRACRHGEMELDLSGNPGAPFALTVELDRVGSGAAASGPRQAVVRVREGAPWPITVRVAATGGSSFRRDVTIENGDTESAPFDVAADGPVLLRMTVAPRVPLGYRGVRVALGGALPVIGLDGAVLNPGGAPFRADVAEAFARDGEVPEMSVISSDPGVANATLVNGTLTVTPDGLGETTVQVAVSYADGTVEEYVFAVTVDAPGRTTTPAVWLFPRAADPDREGFARVVNRSTRGGEVQITAVDDAGMRYGPVVLSMDGRQTAHFNSGDLEAGNAGKGLTEGIGSGQGDWRLTLESDLDIEVLSYIRTRDGFLTSMHDVAPTGPEGLRVVTFNPASNVGQLSLLRLINSGDVEAPATITGVDDSGVSPGEGVQVTVPAGASVTLSSGDLESGSGVVGSLGDGQGKWRLNVDADQPVAAMSLLENRNTGHLTNLSTAPVGAGDGIHRVALFPSASDASGRQGFVRVVNRSGQAGDVRISAYDESDWAYEPMTLAVAAGETVHFNSNDLEVGNLEKGLTGSTGAGTGDWRLELTSDLELDVFAYVRTEDGFLTAVHDTVLPAEGFYPVATLNPGSNVNQVSSLRLVNTGAEAAAVTIWGVDDAGEWSGELRLTVPPGAVREYTAATLETGGHGFEGVLGDGAGKWRLTVVSDRPLTVISLLESPTGHVTNLSTAPRSR
ncbi:MAG: leucine-rich repeat protein [Gammaproteobacteria bacterium]|nr:leucine-rich repeat protein [Gammaproteobacteria bacterium]